MSYPGLFRAGILSILRPGMPPSEVRALDRLGRHISEALVEYSVSFGREEPRQSELEDRRYVLEMAVEEIKTLADLLAWRYASLEEEVDREAPEAWQRGLYTDFALRLGRHLSALALRIEGVLDPSADEVRDWRASLPKKIPEWRRTLSDLSLPARTRRPVCSSSDFIAAEAEADLGLVKEAFDLLRQRTRELREGLRPHEVGSRSEGEGTKRITELSKGLDALVSLAELCYGHAKITLEGDPDAEPDDGP